MELSSRSACLRIAPFVLGLGAPLLAQSTIRVSVGSTGIQGNGESYQHSLSANGRYVAFYSEADNLVLGDANGAADVFVRELRSGTTKLVSVSRDGIQGDDESEYPSISADGRRIAFFSEASNLVPGDTNGVGDVFVRDLVSNTITRASVDSSGVEAQGESAPHFGPAISADGRHVTFFSLAPNLVPGDTNATWDVFVHDLATAVTARVNVDSNGAEAQQSILFPLSEPVLSADGRFVAFESDARNLVPDDTNRMVDVFVHDRLTGVTTRVSVSSAGVEADGRSGAPSISADGRLVSFESGARNLAGGTHILDVFVHDRLTGTTTLASPSMTLGQGDSSSAYSCLSPEGRYVAYQSYATNLVPGDTNGKADVFLRDLVLGTTTRLSLSSQGLQGSRSCYEPSVSFGARAVAFWTAAPELVSGDTNAESDVFLHRVDDRVRH